MIAQWMLSAAVLATLFAFGSNALTSLIARLGIARRFIWLGVMLTSIAVPAIVATLRQPAISQYSYAASTSIQQSPSTPEHTRSFDTLFLTLWGVSVLGLTAFLAAVHRKMRSEVRHLPRRDLLGNTVAVSDEFGPAAVGFLHAEIVVPQWVFQLPADEQQLILRHEQEHVRAGDQFALLAGVTMVALMPWNVGLWWQFRRLRAAVELDCDGRVAPAIADRPRYSQLLLRASARRSAAPFALALAPAPSVLAERLRALLESGRPSGRQFGIWLSAVVACVVTATRIPVPHVALRSATPAPVQAPAGTLTEEKAALTQLPPLADSKATKHATRRSISQRTLREIPPAPDTATKPAGGIYRMTPNTDSSTNAASPPAATNPAPVNSVTLRQGDPPAGTVIRRGPPPELRAGGGGGGGGGGGFGGAVIGGRGGFQAAGTSGVSRATFTPDSNRAAVRPIGTTLPAGIVSRPPPPDSGGHPRR